MKNTLSMALRLAPVEQDGFIHSPADIVQEHVSVAEQVGQVYYSTAISVNKKLLDSFKTVILFNPGSNLFVRAEIVKLRIGTHPFCPPDAKEWSPAAYAEEKKPTWLLLRNFKELRAEDLPDDVLPDGVSVKQKLLMGKRFNRLYF